MGKFSRDKGKRVELECVHWIKEIYKDAERSANQASGASEPDIRKTPFWLECKGGKSIGLWAALEQAIKDKESANDDRPVMLYLSRTNGPKVVVMMRDDFMEECLKR